MGVLREELMRRLRQVTEEEEALLAGGQVDKGFYSSGRGFLIDSEKLLAKGKLITVRPHTRFASFPMHSHNYVEIMYMCSGQTVHHLEGRPPLTLRAGELLFFKPERLPQRGAGWGGGRGGKLHCAAPVF